MSRPKGSANIVPRTINVDAEVYAWYQEVYGGSGNVGVSEVIRRLMKSHRTIVEERTNVRRK